MSQVYMAMITYLLLSYLKFSSRSPLTLYAVAKRIEVSLFDRVDLRSLLAKQIARPNELMTLHQPVQLAFRWDGSTTRLPPPIRRIQNAAQMSQTLAGQGS
jgi:hypothetical protein